MQANRRTLLATLLVSSGLLLPTLSLAQVPAPAPSYPPLVGKYVADTKKQIKTIKLEEFRAALDRKELGLIVDVREEDEWNDGYVPGAINIPRGLIEFRIWKQVGFPNAVDMNKRLTLYCATGGRCALATKSLQDLGFTNAVSVDMKFEDWVKGGNPVVKPAKK
ncbi:MAG: sulfurtransferase [Betaproteobacteria bacterium]|nr:sulfurtransferase [Betaproteobacteria bacterium]